MSTRAWILLGGLTQYGDGHVTSVGMYGLARQIRRLGVPVEIYPWANYDHARRRIILAQHSSKVVVIGYSGGGSRAAWLANQEPRPIIDLMVCYDPSPKWQISDIHGNPWTLPPNVRKCLLYYNQAPLMFGLGGGKLVGHQVETVGIAEQHLAVQFDQSLHDRTVAAVKQLL